MPDWELVAQRGAQGAAQHDQLERAILARDPDLLIVGTITRNSDGAATAAPLVWPDGSPGNYTADALSTDFPGAVDGYHLTYGFPVTETFTQPTMTRDAVSGAVTVRPAIVIT